MSIPGSGAKREGRKRTQLQRYSNFTLFPYKIKGGGVIGAQKIYRKLIWINNGLVGFCPSFPNDIVWDLM